MTLTLYHLSGSPFGWRVQLALEHLGIPYDISHVKFGEGEHRSEAYLRVNPRGKVPALHDGETTLYESSAIVEYLVDRFADGPSLFPADAAERARVRRLISEIDQYYWPAAWQVAQNVYFKPDSDWDLPMIEAGRQGLSKELAFFEGEVRGDGLAGELSAADLALYPFLKHLGRYERRKPDLGLTSQIGPGLQRLMARVEAQPYYERTYPAHWK